jgi:hypothetical protein
MRDVDKPISTFPILTRARSRAASWTPAPPVPQRPVRAPGRAEPLDLASDPLRCAFVFLRRRQRCRTGRRPSSRVRMLPGAREIQTEGRKQSVQLSKWRGLVWFLTVGSTLGSQARVEGQRRRARALPPSLAHRGRSGRGRRRRRAQMSKW